MKFKSDCDYGRMEFADWLLGLSEDRPNDWRLKHWKGSKRRIGSPLAWYYGEIEHFSFDLGLQFYVPGEDPDSPKTDFISKLVLHNRVQDMARYLFERGAIGGKVLTVYRPHEAKGYEVLAYEPHEIMPIDNGWAIQYKGTDGYYERWSVTDTAYEYFEPSKFPASQWKSRETVAHGYGFLPGLLIGHKFAGIAPKPQPAFDWVALELAAEIVSQTLASAAAFNYLGSPWVVSADPEQTQQELAERSQVLSGRVTPEMQDTGILVGGGMPGHHEAFLDRLGQSFADHMRVNWIPNEPPGDTSSLTLRLLHGKTIKAADAVAQTYAGGMAKLISLMLLSAGQDYSLEGVIPTDPATFRVEFDYEDELFEPTPAEKAQLLAVAESLIQMGVRPQVALQEYFGAKTEDEIDEIMFGA